MSNILDQIVEHKKVEIAAAKAKRPLDVVKDDASQSPPVRDFVAALRRTQGIALIAEIKKASPSAGLIRQDFNPVEIARVYERHGAACLSCLTDEHFFQGHLDYLRAIRSSAQIPVLRKDFIIDEYQVWEARAAGADCVLLIAECLDDQSLALLLHNAEQLGMHALIEIHEPRNLDRVLKLNPPLLGINNRDLKTFQTDLGHSIRLARDVPQSTLLVSESGIHRHEDALRLQSAGFQAMLVGESLMRHADIGAQVDELLARPVP